MDNLAIVQIVPYFSPTKGLLERLYRELPSASLAIEGMRTLVKDNDRLKVFNWRRGLSQWGVEDLVGNLDIRDDIFVAQYRSGFGAPDKLVDKLVALIESK